MIRNPNIRAPQHILYITVLKWLMCGLTKIGQDYMLDEWLEHYYCIIILYDIVHVGKYNMSIYIEKYE